MSSLLTTGLISQDFEPRDFSGLILWFDAQDSSTLTLSGTDVTQWNDKSASANHAILNGVNPAPRVGASYNINGYSTVDFKGGILARLTTTSNINISGSQSRDCFTVVKFDSGWTGEYGVWFHGSTGQTARVWAPWWNLSTPRWGLSRWGADGRTTTNITLNTGLILEVSHDDNATGVNFAGINMYVNDPETPLTWDITNANGTNTTNSTLSLGFFTNSAMLRGQIGELLYYNRRLTTIERREVFWYLKKKWGL